MTGPQKTSLKHRTSGVDVVFFMGLNLVPCPAWNSTPLAGETSCLSWASAYHSSCHGHGAVGLTTTFRLGENGLTTTFVLFFRWRFCVRGLDVGRKLGSMVRISGLQPQLYSFVSIVYNYPFANHLLTSWDIQVSHEKAIWKGSVAPGSDKNDHRGTMKHLL